jgi:large subunit ribosomal protein L15
MRPKTKKYRGHKTMGRGGMKRGRGHGEHGGAGKAGAGKHKRASYKEKWGRHGFKRHVSASAKKTLNVQDLSAFDGEVNLTELGYDKLLGSGFIDKPLKVTVTEATAKAVEKIAAAGGEVITG